MCYFSVSMKLIKKTKLFLLFLGMAFLFLFASCGQNRNLFIIIDTSGSMLTNHLVNDVKKSVKKVLLDYKKGDNVFIINFDDEINLLINKTIRTNKDLIVLFDLVDNLSFKGQWTNLVQVLNYSLEKIIELQKKQADKKTVLILYTDGKNDPSPKLKKTFNMNFQDLFDKYYGAKSLQKMWYMYYVELDQIEPELVSFLKSSGAGELVPKQFFNPSVNFTIKNKISMRLFFIGILLLFLIFILVYIFRPWFKKISLIDEQASVDLGSFRKKVFSNYLVLGSQGDIKLPDGGLSKQQAAIGVSIKGSYYIKPLSKDIVKVDNNIVSSQQIIKPGQIIQIGRKKFIFQKND